MQSSASERCPKYLTGTHLPGGQRSEQFVVAGVDIVAEEHFTFTPERGEVDEVDRRAMPEVHAGAPAGRKRTGDLVARPVAAALQARKRLALPDPPRARSRDSPRDPSARTGTLTACREGIPRSR